MNDNEKDPIATLLRVAGPRPKVNPEVTARVRAAVAQEWRAAIRRRRIVRFGVAAAIAATVGAVLLVRPTPETTKVVAPAPIVARVGAETYRAGAEIALPENTTASIEWNGATLRIAGGTRLRFDAVDAATLHHGAVYYADDASGAGVTLHTPFGDVRDVGTRFEVQVRDDAVRVRVRDGAVLLRATIARAGAEVIATRTSIAERKIATSGAEWAWIENAAPPIVLEGKSLEQVLRLIAIEKGLTLDWNGSDQRLRGDVPLSVSEALDAATAAAGVTYRIEGDRLIVRGRA
jgi:ferric-dicitrate binding protein FerR (iron transport regulator)